MYIEDSQDLNKFLDAELGKVKLTKKGEIRKRKPKQDRQYFKEDTELAILEYVATEDQERRNRIYNTRIAYAFYKLAESIIHTFKFYHTDSDTVEELKHEVITMLLDKLKGFKPEKGKAYSYFGTITKRYLIVYSKTNYEKYKETCEVEVVDEDHNVTQDIIKEQNKDDLGDFIDLYISYFDIHINKLFPKEIDRKTADAVIEQFRRREDLEIFNKKALYIYIKEIIDVPTPQITKIIKKLDTLRLKLYKEYYLTGGVRV